MKPAATATASSSQVFECWAASSLAADAKRNQSPVPCDKDVIISDWVRTYWPAPSRVSSQNFVFIRFYSCYTFMFNKALKNHYPPGSCIYSTQADQIVQDTVVLLCHRSTSASASAHVTSWHLSPGCSRGSVYLINGPKFMVPLCESYQKWWTWPLGLVSL